MATLNPYASPTSEEIETPPGRSFARLAWQWPTALLANMPVAAVIGYNLADRAALIGVALATVVAMVSGLLLCKLPEWLEESSVRGIVVLAVAQLFPLLHIAAGACGALVAELLGLLPSTLPKHALPSVTGIAAGFVSALVMWALLLLAGIAIGLLLRLALPQNWWRVKTRDAIFDPPI